MADTVKTKDLMEKDSVARVAYEMMKYFGRDAASKEEGGNPDGYLRLYRKCYLAASGESVSKILKGE